MAETITTDKGFTIVKVNFKEATEICGFGTTINNTPVLVCDRCNELIKGDSYYIAVLNMLFDEDCFNEWHSDAIFYEEDIVYESAYARRITEILYANKAIKEVY